LLPDRLDRKARFTRSQLGEQCRDLTVWTRKDSRNLFKKPLPKAEEGTGPERAACLARFKRSRYYKA